MKEYRAIVVGGNHYNTLGLVRSLGEAGYMPSVLLVGDNLNLSKCFVSKSRYIAKIKGSSISDILESILELGNENYVYVVFPAGDKYANTIDSLRDKFPDNFILHNIDNKAGNIQYFGDKENLRLRAERFGFNTPKTWIVERNNINKATFSYPCIIKALHSDILGKDFGIYQNEIDLNKRLCDLFQKTDKIQVQSFIPKEREIIFLGWSIGDDVQIPCLMEKIREYPQKFGCTGLGKFSPETSKYFPIENLKNLIRSYNYTGLFSVEFILSKNDVYFLEINFRNDGNGYFPGFGGVNLPATFISRLKDGIGDKIDLRIDRSYQMMREFTDFDYMRHSDYSFIQWINDIFKTQVFQYWNRKDPKPFWYILKRKVCKR